MRMPEPGFYQSRIFPWLNDKLGSDPELDALRTEALARAQGRVVEIGFGSGLNLPHYPPAVREVTAVEPNPGMSTRAAPRVAASPIRVTTIRGTAEEMPLPDATFDTAVSVLTLCSVAEPGRALAQLRRVLKPEGRLLFVEHGLAEDPRVARWQNRINGLQRLIACGCNLNRPIEALVTMNGFRFESVRSFHAKDVPKTHGWVTIAAAVKA